MYLEKVVHRVYYKASILYLHFVQELFFLIICKEYLIKCCLYLNTVGLLNKAVKNRENVFTEIGTDKVYETYPVFFGTQIYPFSVCE